MSDNKDISENKVTSIENDFRRWVHQIKNPITVMQLIIQDEDSIDRKEMSLELSKIENYIDMVLPIMQMQMDMDVELKQQNLDLIIRQTIKKFQAQFQHKNLKLNYTPPEFSVYTNDKLLTTVITQLLDNAIKFTQRGTVFIYPENHTDHNAIIIEDTGCGIEEDRLIDIFMRKSSSLGLYLCKNILDKLSCKIIITSTLTNGTKVKISFPITGEK